ncbi:MAG: tellurite resistance TerB family protein [Rhizobiales bacterium]|nr:tellurite resistance TerB family protein [Hyphomicrobiales bacterium]
MFDAKSLLDGLLGGQGQAGQSGGLGAVLGNVLNQVQAQAQQAGLGNVLDQVRDKGIGGVAGNVFGQATGGLRDAAGQIDQSTGASDKLNDIVSQLSGGKSPNEIIAQVKELAANNPGMATAALGGLAAAIFGTGAGRGLAMNTAKLGGLAMIGGLAYRAWQNHQQGKPLLDIAQQPQLLPAPSGSGFDADVDANERAMILNGVKQAGLHAEANAWLEQQINKPASVQELVAAAKGDQQIATQLYTAARIAIEPDNGAESNFLRQLASGLGLAPQLVAQINATAAAAKAG